MYRMWLAATQHVPLTIRSGYLNEWINLKNSKLSLSVAHSLILLLRIILEHLICLSCVAKHRISIGKKSNLRHSRDRWLKDMNRKKNVKGKTIERVHLSHEYLLVAKISLTDCYKRYKKARQFFDHALIQWLFIAFPEFYFTIQNLKCKRATEVDLLLLAPKLANHIHSFG